MSVYIHACMHVVFFFSISSHTGGFLNAECQDFPHSLCWQGSLGGYRDRLEAMVVVAEERRVKTEQLIQEIGVNFIFLFFLSFYSGAKQNSEETRNVFSVDGSQS